MAAFSCAELWRAGVWECGSAPGTTQTLAFLRDRACGSSHVFRATTAAAGRKESPAGDRCGTACRPQPRRWLWLAACLLVGCRGVLCTVAVLSPLGPCPSEARWRTSPPPVVMTRSISDIARCLWDGLALRRTAQLCVCAHTRVHTPSAGHSGPAGCTMAESAS